MQTIHLIHHGYPLSWDQKLPVRGSDAHLRHDPTLAAIGREQAAVTAKHLATAGTLDAVLSSPFRACLETADAIIATNPAPLTVDWRLGQVLLSTVLGSPFSPGSSMDPEWAERRAKAGKPTHPESDQTIHERATTMVRDLKARKPAAQRIAIVAHEIILKELLNRMTGRTITVDWHPCAITTLTLARPLDRTWRMVGKLADVQHLGSADRTEPVERIEHRYHPLDSRS